MTLPPFDMFLKDDRDPIGWEAIEPTQHLTLDQVKIDQLWKERDDVIERALARGYYTALDYAEMESIVAIIDELMKELEA